MKELNRFNMIQSGRLYSWIHLILIGGVIVSGGVLGCKKKDRLTNSTFNLGITPPAALVLTTGSLTLTAHGSSNGQSIGVSPTWSVSPSTVGSLNVSIGSVVIFTPVALGVATVVANYDGLMATSQIDVVTYIPENNTTAFNVYTDDGLPSEAGITSDIFTSGGLSIAELSTGYTPEGVNYQRTTNAPDDGYWGVTLDDNSLGQNKNLSSYNSGSLKFSLRLVDRTLAGSENIRINIEDLTGPFSVNLISGGGGVFGFNRLNMGGWQEISIPVSQFTAGGLNTTQVKVPFAIIGETLSSPLTFDVDAVRWEP